MKKVFFAATVVLFACWSTFGAVITWGKATTVSEDSDVLTEGTLLEAYSFGYTGSYMANGIKFVGARPAELPNYAYAYYNDETMKATYKGYYDMLRTASYASDRETHTLPVGGGNLVSGQKYKIQVWHVDDRSGKGSRTMTLGDGESANTVLLGADPGYYAIGTFTAGSGTQDLTITGNRSAMISGYQIRAID